MIELTAEFMLFLTVYTLVLIAVGQFGSFLTKQRIIGSSMAQFFIFIFTVALLLIANVVIGTPEIFNASVNIG